MVRALIVLMAAWPICGLRLECRSYVPTGSFAAMRSERRMSLQGRYHAEPNAVGLPKSSRCWRRRFSSRPAEVTSLGSRPTWCSHALRPHRHAWLGQSQEPAPASRNPVARVATNSAAYGATRRTSGSRVWTAHRATHHAKPGLRTKAERLGYTGAAAARRCASPACCSNCCNQTR